MADSVSLASEGLRGKIRVPPSKSYTHRAVLTASLCSGTSKVLNPLASRDTNATVAACRAMGAGVSEETDGSLTVSGCEPRAPENVVNVENSGTTLRFMTSVFALPERGLTVLTGDATIRRRPMQGLLDALSSLGANARSSLGNGRAPIIVGEGGIKGGKADVQSDVSSQFVSSLLISSPLAKGDTTLRLGRSVSRPYVEATLRLSGLHGISFGRVDSTAIDIQCGQEYRPADFRVPGDFGSAAFIMAAVALVGGEVELSDLDPSLPQGDSEIVGILHRLGVNVVTHDDSIMVRAEGGNLRGGSFDLTDSPDLLPILSVLSLGCEDPVDIGGVAHARYKESDRVGAAAEALRMVGAAVEERQDGLHISKPKTLAPAVLDAHDDHRLFMAFAVASLLAPRSVKVRGSESLDVSYPAFLSDMKAIGAEVVQE